MLSTIDDFLAPWQGPQADELVHSLSPSARLSSVDGRYEELAQTEMWHAFNSSNICSSSKMRGLLDLQFTPQWQSWLADLDRIIHNERQLESLYHRTLVTRVNIALQNAISPRNHRVTVVVCPGSFDSYDPRNGEKTVILPDWIVIEGTYSPHDVSLPRLEDLAHRGKIVAVGDTKLVRRPPDAVTVNERARYAEDVDGTHSCHRSYLAQVQHYAHMLGIRFGFVLTNQELVLAQFLREAEPTPRLPRYRGLRSVTENQQLKAGLPSDFRSSEPGPVYDGEGSQMESSDTSRQRQKRNLSGDTPFRPSPAVIRRNAPEGRDGLSSSLSAWSQMYDLPSSPPDPSPVESGPADSAAKLALTPAQQTRDANPSTPNQFPLTSPDQMSTPWKGQFPSSSLTYAPSERDYDIGRVLVQSFRIPNSHDTGGMETWEDNQSTKKTHPAKALFALLMLAYFAGEDGRMIDTEEIGFETL